MLLHLLERLQGPADTSCCAIGAGQQGKGSLPAATGPCEQAQHSQRTAQSAHRNAPVSIRDTGVFGQPTATEAHHGSAAAAQWSAPREAQHTKHSIAVAARYVSRFSPLSDSRLGVTPAAQKQLLGSRAGPKHAACRSRGLSGSVVGNSPTSKMERNGTLFACSPEQRQRPPVALRPQRSTSRSVSVSQSLESRRWHSSSCVTGNDGPGWQQ